MVDRNFRKRAELLLHVLPHVSREESLALHGGTAINLFSGTCPGFPSIST